MNPSQPAFDYYSYVYHVFQYQRFGKTKRKYVHSISDTRFRYITSMYYTTPGTHYQTNLDERYQHSRCGL